MHYLIDFQLKGTPFCTVPKGTTVYLWNWGSVSPHPYDGRGLRLPRRILEVRTSNPRQAARYFKGQIQRGVENVTYISTHNGTKPKINQIVVVVMMLPQLVKPNIWGLDVGAFARSVKEPIGETEFKLGSVERIPTEWKGAVGKRMSRALFNRSR